MSAFEPVSSKVNFPELEAHILEFWRADNTFRESIRQREGAPNFVFYEGPPTANGQPHVGHVMARSYKDLFPRYKTMCGYRVLRKGGWDTHGLPVELEVEKEIGVSTKQEIEAYGMERFNAKCRESVFRYEREWRRMTERLGFWIDMDDPYITLDNRYVESVWWILRQIWDKGLLYQDYKVVPYCPRCGTALSSHEVALGYDEAEDPSIYVRFPLEDDSDVSLLVWTTTPWTLPGNAAAAVNPELTYVEVRQAGHRLILAEALLGRALEGEYEVVRRFKGEELVERRYRAPFDFVASDKPHHYVIAADFVSAEDGTGIVHVAPAFGADDLRVGRQYDLPVLQPVDASGRFTEAVAPWAGVFIKDADRGIMEDLRARGLLYRSGTIRHTYPFCWRCSTPLMYYARSSWFIRTTAVQQQALDNNLKINWYPPYLKHGRVGNFLESMVDWALSRERYWGTPLPIWECDNPDCRQRHCIGSVQELRDRARGNPALADLHRPFIDDVVLACPVCSGDMRRVPEVIDTWFDSGSMPVAQYHYPFENREVFREQFPADFICEGLDQTRGWFYSLHMISTLLFDQPSYLNCLCHGLLLGPDGQKMSKSRGNVISPWEVFDTQGADAFRWYLFSAAPPAQERRLSVELVAEVVRKFLLTLWNTYSFFVTYANLDGFDPGAPPPQAERLGTLDRWILSRLNTVIHEVRQALDRYDPTASSRAIQAFVDDLSNWYVRRGRRRYWKSGSDEDKRAAHATLYRCLVTVAQLMAPFAPFTSEAIYRNLVARVDPAAPRSVHLTDYPAADEAEIDQELLAAMELGLRVATAARALRSKAAIRVRQPLPEVLVVSRQHHVAERLLIVEREVRDELNVKRLEVIEDEARVADFRVIPNLPVLGPKYGARLRAIRAALPTLATAANYARYRAGEALSLEAEGQVIELLPEELEFQLVPREGYLVSQEGDLLVALDTRVDPALRAEGMAREVAHLVNTMRREADFDIADRIHVVWSSQGAVLRDALGAHRAYIQQETLAASMAEAPEGRRDGAVDYGKSLQVEGQAIWIGLRRAGERT